MKARKLKTAIALFLCATMSLASCDFTDSAEDDETGNGGSSSKGMLGRAEEQTL